MLNLNATLLKSVPVLVEPMAALIESLADQNDKLCAARDLLIPRLMSGEIAV